MTDGTSRAIGSAPSEPQASKWLGRFDGFDLAALIVVLAFVAAGLVAIARTGPTVDEPNHFTRGVAIWQTGDPRLSFAHPPLANTLAAAPAAAEGELGRVDETSAWSVADPGEVGMGLAVENYSAFRRGIMRGRVVQLAWGVALLVSLFRFVRRQLGPWPAIAATVTLGLCPTFVAHNAVLTTDGPVTAATFWLLTAAWEHGRHPDRSSAIRIALACALVPVVKLSGPILVLLGLLAFAIARWTADGDELGDRRRRLRAIGVHAVLSGVITLVSINLAYGADRTMMTVAQIRAEPEPVHFLSAQVDASLIDHDSIIDRLPATLRVPVPYAYVYGLAVVRAQSKRRAPNWFLGRTRSGRHPAYVPLMLFAKSPVAWWLLLGVLVVQAIRRRTLPPSITIFCAAFVVVYALLASRSHAQLGVRYLLPTFPLLAVVSATAFLEAFAPRRRGLLLGAVATTPLAIVIAGGHNLGWFNPAVGGRAGGHRISMIGEDWAQDLGDLAVVVRELDAHPLYFEVYNRYGPIELAYHGVSFEPLECRQRPDDGEVWVAVHRARELRYGRRCHGWRDRIVETFDIAHHLRLYRLRPARGRSSPS